MDGRVEEWMNGTTIQSSSHPTILLLVCLFCSSATILFSQNGTWLRKADFRGSARLGAIGFSAGNKGYITGGMDTANLLKNDLWEFDPQANSWAQKASFPGNARQSAVVFSIGTKAYITTGYDARRAKKDTWEYDAQENYWTQKKDFGGVERFSAVAFSIGEKGYVTTGFKEPNSFKDLWEYDPAADAWTQKADFAGKARSGAVAFSIGKKGYVGMGWKDPNILKDLWEYSPENNSWTQKANLTGTARYGAVAFSAGDKGYVCAGDDGEEYKNDAWQYDPATDSWAAMSAFTDLGRWGAVGFSVGEKGYIGTGFIGRRRKEISLRDFWEFQPPAKASFIAKKRNACTGKILYSTCSKEGPAKVKILLLNGSDSLLQTSSTDSAGMFRFEKLSPDESYTLRIEDNDSLLINQKKLFLADSAGRIVRSVRKGAGRNFSFAHLPSDLAQLTSFSEIDPSLKNFSMAGNFYIGADMAPFENARVNLLNEKGEIIRKAVTNPFGSFVFANLPSDQNFSVALDETDPQLLAQMVYFTSKNGVVLYKGEMKMFRFAILASDAQTLATLTVDDNELIADLHGKLFSSVGSDLKSEPAPLRNVKIALLNERCEVETVDSTDADGNFTLEGIPATHLYLTLLQKGDASVVGKNVFLASSDKTILGILKSSAGKLFRYEILPVEENNLASIYFNDPWLMVAQMNSQKKKDSVLVISENIYYETNKWNVLPSAVPVLNKVAELMKKNSLLRIEIISHTDCRGTSEHNLTLSEKRAQTAVKYICTKGVDKARLSATGMGETKPVNRCKDGVDCTEEELAKNRRTEFKIR